MHLLKTSINSNPNVGLYSFVNDKFALVGIEVPDELAKQYEEVLQVPVHKVTIAGTSLIGVFVAGNNDTILIPDIAFEEELKVLDDLGINYSVISTKLTALGNNILCNDHGAVINPDFTIGEIEQLQEALAIPIEKLTIAGLEIVGSCAAMNSKGGIAHREISQKEILKIKELLKIELEPSTLNLGSPYISSGILVNDNGFIVGDLSGGPEITFADECLGFLDN